MTWDRPQPTTGADRSESGVAIDVRGLTCRFGTGDEAHAALDGLDLEIPRGRVTAVVGPSGAGKSTLLRVVAGLTRPDAGDVLFDGRSVVALAPEKRRLGMVFQSYALFPHLSVADNVAFAPRVAGASARAARQRTAEILERLEIAPLADRHPHQLSGGERQRVALARALAAEPRALLLDEPLAALDARLRLALREELAHHLSAAGLTALYVTHDQEEAMALGDRVAVLRAGRLEQVGPAEELYRSPATPFVATFFGEANFVPVTWDPAAGYLRGPLGEVAVDEETAARFTDAQEARWMLRPEAFHLANDLADGLVDGDGAPSSSIRGRVKEAVFLGGRRRLRVEVEGIEELLKVDLPASPPVATGALVALRVDPRATALLSAGESNRSRPLHRTANAATRTADHSAKLPAEHRAEHRAEHPEDRIMSETQT